MHVEPQKEHQWLDQLLGEWTFEIEASTGPDQPPGKFTGFESVRSIGGVWVVCEGRSEMPGGGLAVTIMTLGFDPAKQRYLGTFIGSMMTHLWIYDGAMDPSGKILTLDAEGPDFTVPGKQAKYQDRIEIKSDDHRMLNSRVLGDDGQWHDIMTADYRRAR